MVGCHNSKLLLENTLHACNIQTLPLIIVVSSILFFLKSTTTTVTTVSRVSHGVSLCAYLIALDNLSPSTQFVQIILIKLNSLERYAF